MNFYYKSFGQAKRITQSSFIDEIVVLSESTSVPVLTHPKLDNAVGSWPTILEHFQSCSKNLAQSGGKQVVLSVDEDGLLQSILSPRTQMAGSWEDRLELVLAVFDIVHEKFPNIGVALTVEELCPGGLDATDGIRAALAFEERGAKWLIASGGTQDFPALKRRRATSLKEERPDITLESPEPWLASAAWVSTRLQIPVWAQGDPHNWSLAAQIANQISLKGIVIF